MKKFQLIIIILAVCVTLQSCGKEKVPLEIDLGELLAEINVFIPADSLYELSDYYLEDVYGFELAEITQYAAFKAEDQNNADEILLFEANSEYVDKVYELISKIQSRLLIEIENYTNNPAGMDQYSKAKSSVMVREKNYVFFVVSDYNDDIREVVRRFVSGD